MKRRRVTKSKPRKKSKTEFTGKEYKEYVMTTLDKTKTSSTIFKKIFQMIQTTPLKYKANVKEPINIYWAARNHHSNIVKFLLDKNDYDSANISSLFLTTLFNFSESMSKLDKNKSLDILCTLVRHKLCNTYKKSLSLQYINQYRMFEHYFAKILHIAVSEKCERLLDLFLKNKYTDVSSAFGQQNLTVFEVLIRPEYEEIIQGPLYTTLYKLYKKKKLHKQKICDVLYNTKTTQQLYAILQLKNRIKLPQTTANKEINYFSYITAVQCGHDDIIQKAKKDDVVFYKEMWLDTWNGFKCDHDK